MTAQDYALKHQQELEEDNNRRARQLLSLKFSYLTGADRAKYKAHVAEYGNSTESLQRFNELLRGY